MPPPQRSPALNRLAELLTPKRETPVTVGGKTMSLPVPPSPLSRPALMNQQLSDTFDDLNSLLPGIGDYGAESISHIPMRGNATDPVDYLLHHESYNRAGSWKPDRVYINPNLYPETSDLGAYLRDNWRQTNLTKPPADPRAIMGHELGHQVEKTTSQPMRAHGSDIDDEILLLFEELLRSGELPPRRRR